MIYIYIDLYMTLDRPNFSIEFELDRIDKVYLSNRTNHLHH